MHGARCGWACMQALRPAPCASLSERGASRPQGQEENPCALARQTHTLHAKQAPCCAHCCAAQPDPSAIPPHLLPSQGALPRSPHLLASHTLPLNPRCPWGRPTAVGAARGGPCLHGLPHFWGPAAWLLLLYRQPGDRLLCGRAREQGGRGGLHGTAPPWAGARQLVYRGAGCNTCITWPGGIGCWAAVWSLLAAPQPRLSFPPRSHRPLLRSLALLHAKGGAALPLIQQSDRPHVQGSCKTQPPRARCPPTLGTGLLTFIHQALATCTRPLRRRLPQPLQRRRA